MTTSPILPISPEIVPDLSRWPDGAPAVSVDVSFGKRARSVDVDPYSLMNLFKDLDVPDDRMSDATVIVSDVPAVAKFFKAGDYRRGTKTIRITPDDQSYLTHEGKHFSDDLKGLIDSNLDFKNRRVGAILGLGVGAVASVVAIKSGVGPHLLPDWYKATALTAYGTFAGRHAVYRLSSSERRAFKAQKSIDFEKSYGSIITVDKK